MSGVRRVVPDAWYEIKVGQFIPARFVYQAGTLTITQGEDRVVIAVKPHDLRTAVNDLVDAMEQAE